MEENQKFSRKEVFIIIALIIFLASITFLTSYNGSTDVGDYSYTAKFFSGDYSAKIRSSHSFMLGVMHFPFVALFQNLIIFKITSLIFLFLIIYSVYFVSKNKKAFWLIFISPAVWYMAPWINPIQLSSLLFFWAYIFIKKYNETKKIKFLSISGFLLGFSWCFWDAMFFFMVIFIISFFYNKKILELLYFGILLFIGLLPKLLLDQFLFGFAFSGILRYIFGIVSAMFYKGIYGNMGSGNIFWIFVLLFLPFFVYKFYNKDFIKNNLSFIIFLTLSILLLLKNSQIRYTLILIPIIIYELSPIINKKNFKNLIIFSSILCLITIIPYTIQITKSSNAEEFQTFVLNIKNLKIYENPKLVYSSDLSNLLLDYKNQSFIVGNQPDDYSILADAYWGKNVREFVSIQDYQLWKENKTILFEKKFMPVPSIADRRQIWLAGGISKNENDKTNYSQIQYAIGLDSQINLTGFTFIKQYNSLYLSRKI